VGVAGQEMRWTHPFRDVFHRVSYDFLPKIRGMKGIVPYSNEVTVKTIVPLKCSSGLPFHWLESNPCLAGSHLRMDPPANISLQNLSFNPRFVHCHTLRRGAWGQASGTGESVPGCNFYKGFASGVLLIKPLKALERRINPLLVHVYGGWFALRRKASTGESRWITKMAIRAPNLVSSIWGRRPNVVNKYYQRQLWQFSRNP